MVRARLGPGLRLWATSVRALCNDVDALWVHSPEGLAFDPRLTDKASVKAAEGYVAGETDEKQLAEDATKQERNDSKSNLRLMATLFLLSSWLRKAA